VWSPLSPVYFDDQVTVTAEFAVQPIDIFYKLSNISVFACHHAGPDNISELVPIREFTCLPHFQRLSS
jgi:hypothetical protein